MAHRVNTMAHRVKRSLYIGLGGTGMKALLQAKKRFMDTYLDGQGKGEVPPMVSFLGLDADRNEFNNTLLTERGEVVEFAASDRMGIYVQGANQFYNNNKRSFNWMPTSNVPFLANLTHFGCGAIRTNGHFALTVNVENITREITSRLRQIANANIINNPRYVIDGGVPEIHLVFSVCGGTGSGTFIHMAYLIRKIAADNNIPNIKIRGYAVLPGIFQGLPVTPRVKPNAYKALCDLDYLMHLDDNSPAYEVTFMNGRVDKYVGRPFDSVTLIDNHSAVGAFNITEVGDLSEMVGIALATSAGTLDNIGTSIGDNQTQLIISKAMDVENKRGWVGGMAACEIIYSGSTLSNIYQLKAQSLIIDRLFNSCEDANNIANGWIDSAEVRIRENNGEDQLTDTIHPRCPDYQFSVSSYESPDAEIEQSKGLNKIKEEELKRIIEEKVASVKKELRRFMVANINRECGLQLSQDIVAQLQAQIAICLNEMREEKDKLDGELELSNGTINTYATTLKNIAGTLFKRGLSNAIESLNNAVNEFNTTSIDIQRHSAAISIYNSILVVLNDYADKLAKIEKSLRTIKSNINLKIAQLQNGATNFNPLLQIDLANQDLKNIAVKYEDINFNNFLMVFSNEVNLLDFDQVDTASIEGYLSKYSATLPVAKSYLDKSVESVLASLKANDLAAFNDIVKRANALADIKLSYSPQGRNLPMSAPRIMYIGVENSNSCLNDPQVLEEFSDGAMNFEHSTVTVVTTNMKERVMLYRQVGVFPMFMVPSIHTYDVASTTNIDAFRDEYGFDVDMLLGRRMIDDGYSIDPINTDPIIDTLDLWVRGFIYGRIKNENGCYYIMSERLGSFSDGNWIRLKEWRDEAYELFCTDIDKYADEFLTCFREAEVREGSEATRNRFSDADQNYNRISQIGVTMATLRTRPYARVKRLFDQEGNYLRRLTR